MKKHRSEVRNMLYTEWNMEDACRVAAEEAREQALKEVLKRGLKEGIVQGKLESILMLKGVLSPEVLAEKFQLPLEEVLRILDADSATALQKQ